MGFGYVGGKKTIELGKTNCLICGSSNHGKNLERPQWRIFFQMHHVWQISVSYTHLLGSGVGGLGTLEEQHKVLLSRGPSRISPFSVSYTHLDVYKRQHWMYFY